MCVCVRRRFRVLIKSEGGGSRPAAGPGYRSSPAKEATTTDDRGRDPQKGEALISKSASAKPATSQHMCFLRVSLLASGNEALRARFANPVNNYTAYERLPTAL